jgi:hypothetical protein
MDFQDQFSPAQYETPQISELEEMGNYAVGPGVIIIVCVGVALLALLGALGVCIYFGYDGIAYIINTNNFSATLACYKNN